MKITFDGAGNCGNSPEVMLNTGHSSQILCDVTPMIVLKMNNWTLLLSGTIILNQMIR